MGKQAIILLSLLSIAFTGAYSLLGMKKHVYYRTCWSARAAGAAPIYNGQPGYRNALDADGDGVACEPYKN